MAASSKGRKGFSIGGGTESAVVKGCPPVGWRGAVGAGLSPFLGEIKSA